MSENKEHVTSPTFDELKELKQIPTYRFLYMFEVQLLTDKGDFVHRGYMNKLFYSKQDACLFYQLYNLEMRPLNQDGDYISDVHPANGMRYKLVIFKLEKLTIPPFDGIISPIPWMKKPFTIFKDGKVPPNFEFGKPMGKGASGPVGEFPFCGTERCWCYDCSMHTSRPSNFDTVEYNEDYHRLIALRLAKILREKFMIDVMSTQMQQYHLIYPIDLSEHM
jgi:hypothetical protein